MESGKVDVDIKVFPPSLFFVCIHNWIFILQIFAKKDFDGETPLCCALVADNQPVVRALLMNCADPAEVTIYLHASHGMEYLFYLRK